MENNLWGEIKETFLTEFFPQAGYFLGKLILAIIVFLIGWLVAAFIGRVIALILEKLKFNRLFEKGSWKAAIEKAELKVVPSEFVGAIFKWAFVIVVLQLAVGILGWVQFAELLGDVIGYLPNVIVAALIFVVAVIISDILEKVVVVATEGVRFISSHIAGVIVKWAIWIFAILIILRQLLIAPTFVDTLFKALVYGVVAVFVIAFGLGGKDVAAEVLKDIKEKIKK